MPVASANRAAIRTRVGGLVRLVYRDPDHLAERLTLYAADVLGPPSRDWAERMRREHPDVPPARLGEELRQDSARVARVNGAIAGTPFLIALVPGYVSYLWQEARMVLRIAALNGRDPTTIRTAAEVLALRGARATVDEAEQALLEVQGNPLPAAPSQRRSWRTWFDSVYRLLVFGGFLAPRGAGGDGRRNRVRSAVTAVVATAVWVTTWVLPVTFMLAMAWGCESHARSLGRRALDFYAGGALGVQAAAASAEARRGVRRTIRGVLLALSIAVPIAFVAYVDHVRNTVGINWLGALGALVAVSLVGAVSVAAARR